MLHLARCLAIAMIVIVAGGAAQAHGPRLSGPDLPIYNSPGGPLIFLRLLHGEGTSVRPVVLGAQGEVYALGPVGDAAAIWCRSTCKAVVFRTGNLLPQVLVPDKAKLRLDTVYRVTEADEAATAAAERAPETFAFFAVPLSPALLVEAILIFVAESPASAALVAAIALGLWPVFRLALAASRARVPRRRAVLAAAAAGCALATFGLWVFVWGVLSVVTGFPRSLSMLITGAAAVAVLSWIAFAEARRRRAAAA
jgi:hypothetical protein